MKTGRLLPHPIPYQGSKRGLTQRILPLFPRGKVRLFEPFAGSAAVSIAACANDMVSRVVLSDANEPLMELWKRITCNPYELISAYKHLWDAQLGKERLYYNQIRDEFNQNHNPDFLLYLLARCVKASVRYNSRGEFNQSPDNRRKGAKPETIAKHILGASRLLKDITNVRHGDFREAIIDANPEDIIYLAPPYQGVCNRRDNRYFEGLPFGEFVAALRDMNRRRLSFIISYDGRTGEKTYGNMLPDELNLRHIEVEAGISSQGTLLGRNASTVESLYISPALLKRIDSSRIDKSQPVRQAQLSFL
ncbi:MAG: DNA adenine methylase [Deltaproteobacteria bacterium]|nr:DNA adenine methylase [Deltaproteobacteria bacterium]